VICSCPDYPFDSARAVGCFSFDYHVQGIDKAEYAIRPHFA
jgi:hypothetical protein